MLSTSHQNTTLHASFHLLLRTTPHWYWCAQFHPSCLSTRTTHSTRIKIWNRVVCTPSPWPISFQPNNRLHRHNTQSYYSLGTQLNALPLQTLYHQKKIVRRNSYQSSTIEQTPIKNTISHVNNENMPFLHPTYPNRDTNARWFFTHACTKKDLDIYFNSLLIYSML